MKKINGVMPAYRPSAASYWQGDMVKWNNETRNTIKF